VLCASLPAETRSAITPTEGKRSSSAWRADLLTAFLSNTSQGQAIARGRLRINPTDGDALFSGEAQLICVWLHVETLGRKTGWSVWEAGDRWTPFSKTIHSTAELVLRAWIDYIVDTKMARHALAARRRQQEARSSGREAASAESEFFVRVEAEFALWECWCVNGICKATGPEARAGLSDNRKLSKFLETTGRLSIATSVAEAILTCIPAVRKLRFLRHCRKWTADGAIDKYDAAAIRSIALRP
jgi:hypothetical protein